MVDSLNTALVAADIPPEVLKTLLDLAEFMEHDSQPLPIDSKTLASLSHKSKAYAKALYYKENELRKGHLNDLLIEDLLSINNLLGQPEASRGT